MKSHPRNSRLLGAARAPGRFIFGDALENGVLEGCEYVIHTASPAFICRLVGNDLTPFEGRDEEGFVSTILFDEPNNTSIYVCNNGFRLYDFNFKGNAPDVEELQRLCDEAMEHYLQLHEQYREREQGYKQREMRIGPTEPLPPPARLLAIEQLTAQARNALQDPVAKIALESVVRTAISGGDQAVFTEAQLALLDEPAARGLLTAAARDCIAFPEVVRQDGSIMSFELWAIPFCFSRAKGGVWWHFPMLERVEPLLADALEMPPNAILWLSPTLFTVDMLNERSCQSLIHLAPVMDAGCDFAPVDPEHARATFEAADKTLDPQWVVSWIPFLVERGTLSLDSARRFGRRALDAILPSIQEAISSQMEYGEAEIFAPLPWWDAVSAGVMAANRKRLALTVTMIAGPDVTPAQLEALVTYQPELAGYEITLRRQGSDKVLAVSPWLMVPDVAPDRHAALEDLRRCLDQAGLSLVERAARLH